ncbi:MAG: 50S ribosomal protein L4 [Deltaproteobacteria bacterium]|nr:50S ribosomal protein L4 [Deltaproteobacteria bacterium]MBW2051723.1 50S ribosomal protein L4 [Deltaproteobacteria bacterium]MBW2140262.1 50S ribosomal protein L4 [Deltaproteobacteria bacterium]MBW2322105.1 50S ribosomal protein L4 [Deltaproteobacteria bacterium]
MVVVDILNLNKEKVGQAELPADIFDVPLRQHLVHEVVLAQLANRRAGTASTKGRSEVRGSTHKLYRQKGTGRARAGTRKSPLLRGGGTIFGPKPRDFSYQPPKKVRRNALKTALTAKVKENELLILDAFDLPEIKTRRFVEAMAGLELDNALIVTPESNENLERSARNVPKIKVLRSAGLNVYDVVKYRHLILLEPCIAQITERLQK